MTHEEFDEYLNRIVNTDEFQELDKFLMISDFEIEAMSFKVMFYLIEQYQAEYEISKANQLFHDFFEAYKKKEAKIYFDKDGFIDLSKTLYLKQPFRYAQNPGRFTSGWYIFSDGSIYLSKIPIYYDDEFSLVDDTNCQYNPVIATGIAKELGIATSENFIARKRDGQLRILSKYFLKENEELITFYEHRSHQKISEILNELEKTLLLRKFPKDQIEKAKFDFLKQEFLAKLIGLCDQTGDNTPLIISRDQSGQKSVRLAPMYDYDFSFHMLEGIEFRVRQADNGKTDIGSFVDQYKNYPGFLEFVKKSINTLDMERVYKNIYKETGIKFFEKSDQNPVLKEGYTKFVNRNIDTVRATLKNIERRKLELMKLYDYE